MSLTIDESGDALAQTVEGITLPINCSFEKVNGWIHGSDVHFEEVQALCLGMATENDHLRAKLAAMESQEPFRWALDHFALGVGTTLFGSEQEAIDFSRNLAGSSKAMPLYGKPVPADKPAPEHKGWYCAHCQCGVDPSEVTYNEAHTVCGRIITDDEPPVRADKPAARITEQDAREMCRAWINYQNDDDAMLSDFEWDAPEWRTAMTALLKKLNSDREQMPEVAVPDESYFALADEIFELGVDVPAGEAPGLSAIYAILDKHLSTAPSHSQQSSDIDGFVKYLRDRYRMDVSEQRDEYLKKLSDLCTAHDSEGGAR